MHGPLPEVGGPHPAQHPHWVRVAGGARAGPPSKPQAACPPVRIAGPRSSMW